MQLNYKHALNKILKEDLRNQILFFFIYRQVILENNL